MSEATALPLAGKNALVTGSSRGIGAAIAKKLAADGARVIINFRYSTPFATMTKEEIDEAASGEERATLVPQDISSLKGAQTLCDKTLEIFEGKIDILVCNAAALISRTLEELDEGAYEDTMDTNLRGPLFLTKYIAPHMQSGGRIVFMSTTLTRASSVAPNALLYIASKGAIEQVVRALAKDLGARGITVNAVSPGAVDSSIFRAGKSESQIKMIANLNPQRRLGEADDIAPTIAFLVSPAAKWINGQNIPVNGGYTT